MAVAAVLLTALVRDFGKAAFVVLQDRTCCCRCTSRRHALGEENVDLEAGGMKGTLFKSKTATLAASELTLGWARRCARCPQAQQGRRHERSAEAALSKSRSTTPSLRRPAVNPSVRETFKKRTKLVQFIRNFLDAREVRGRRAPMMHSLVSARAKLLQDAPQRARSAAGDAHRARAALEHLWWAAGARASLGWTFISGTRASAAATTRSSRCSSSRRTPRTKT